MAALLAMTAGLVSAYALNFAAVAIALARRNEIGLRIAIGATPLEIMRLVLGSGLRPILGGAALGHSIVPRPSRCR